MIRDDLVYLEHILDCLKKIQEYSLNIELKEFIQNSLIQDAIIRKFEVIGEATKNISQGLKSSNSNLSWVDMARMRDKLIHHYFDVDLNILWDTIHNDVPILLVAIQTIINEFADNK